MSRALIYTLIAILAVLLAPGCSSKEITRDDVTGKYVANFPHDEVAFDMIEVMPDGTYIHTFGSTDGETAFTENGTWDFEYYDGPYEREPRIGFNNYTLAYREPKGIELLEGGATFEVKKDGAWFIISSDSFFHYERLQ